MLSCHDAKRMVTGMSHMVNKFLFCALTCIAMSNNGYSQSNPEVLPAPEPDQSVCIDNEPIGDGFGWNGTCGCVVDESFSLSGGERTNEIGKDLVAAASFSSASSCIDSGSVFLFSPLDGQWGVTAELIPSVRHYKDGFPDHIEMSENTVVASSDTSTSDRPDSYLAVFDSADGFNWYESQIIRPGTLENIGFHGFALSGDTLAYTTSDFTRSDNGFIAPGSWRQYVHIWERESDGVW